MKNPSTANSAKKTSNRIDIYCHIYLKTAIHSVKNAPSRSISQVSEIILDLKDYLRSSLKIISILIENTDFTWCSSDFHEIRILVLMVLIHWWNVSEASETPGYLGHFKTHEMHHFDYFQIFCEMLLKGALFTICNESFQKSY